MINRSPPFTRQRARDAAALQQQQNGVLGNLSRPNNTANTQNRNVSLNNRVDGELLESEESMGSNEIRNALLNVAAPVEQNGQQAARNEAGRGGGNFEQQHVDGGLRIRLQNVGRNNGQEWRIRNENLNDGHRIFNPAPQNVRPRTSTPYENMFEELRVEHTVECRPHNQNFKQIFKIC
ncbi:hypothetical protein niasHT_022928 [Heterodera trifolii]|uniref:Uncharacterized protein n=1 Tax=Heterodera trifolii TaxID=157864 RepID=A0ABD2JYR0_9BILA